MQENPYSASVNANSQHQDITKSKITRIKRFSPVQLGKMFAVMYGLISLIFVPLFLILSSVSPKGSGLGVGIGMAIALPIIYTIFGFLTGIIGAFIYNVVAKLMGGIEVETE